MMDQIKQYILEQVNQKRLSKERALDLLQEVLMAEQPKNAAAPVAPAEDKAVAIVGMASRLPRADDPAQFWALLHQGRDAYAPFPEQRLWDVVRVKREIWDQHGESVAQAVRDRAFHGYYLDSIDRFDPGFFDCPPAEAVIENPANRLFLTVAWEALENAGFTKRDLRGSRTGVYLAHTPDNAFPYERLLPNDDPRVMPLNNPGITGYRLSHWLDLRGPTVNINTTCSSSLVAAHIAYRALRAREIDLAIVGAISLDLHPQGLQIEGIGVDSPNGRCKAYAAGADGIRFGEGVLVLVLRRLDDALGAGDRVRAVLRGSAINCDGRSSGLTVPNPAAQADVLRTAWEDAGIGPQDLDCIEGHGAGTKIGDPIEVQGITEACATHTAEKQFLRIGSTKTNISHLGDAAGLSGLLKTILCLGHRQFVPSLHFDRPNPLIAFEKSAVKVQTVLAPWEATTGRPRRAGVSSFGISGTNCHIVVEEAPREESVARREGPSVLVLSARTMGSLWRLCAKYVAWLETEADTNLYDLCFSAARRRDHYPHRLAIRADDIADLRRKLARLVQIRDYESVSIESLRAQGIQWGTVAEETSARPAPRHLAEAARAYIQFQDVDWDGFFLPETGRYVPLPTTAFDDQRCWPSFEVPDETAIDQLFWSLRWVERAGASATRSLDGTWLLLGAETPLAREIARRLSIEGADVVRLDRPSEDRWDDILEPLLGRLPTPLRGAIHLDACLPAADDMESLETIERTQEEGIVSLFHFARALIRRVRDAFELVVVSAFAFGVEASPVLPNRVTIHGLAKVLSQECPWIRTSSLDLDAGLSSDEALADHVLRELRSRPDQRPDVVAYRRGRRFCQELDRARPSEGARPSPWREGGTYLLAGGGGALGVALAQDVARRVRARFVIVGRSPEPPAARWAEITARGSEVVYLQADVTDVDAITRAVADVRARFGSIDGVVVAQKQLFHKLITELTPGELREGLRNRIRGTWLLDRLCREDAPPFFLMLSSISSLLGTKTAAECCAVNLYLDGYADYLRSMGRAGQTLNLTNILDDASGRLGPTPIPAISTSRFTASVHRFLESAERFAIVAEFDWDEVEHLRPVLKLPFRPSAPVENDGAPAANDTLRELVSAVVAGKVSVESAIGRLDGAPAHSARFVPESAPANEAPPEVKARVKGALAQVWHEILGFREVEEHSNFFEVGGSSISVIKFARVLGERLGIHLPVAEIYAHPTFEGMLHRLAGLLASAEQRESA